MTSITLPSDKINTCYPINGGCGAQFQAEVYNTYLICNICAMRKQQTSYGKVLYPLPDNRIYTRKKVE